MPADDLELSVKRRRWRMIGWLAALLIAVAILWLMLRASDSPAAPIVAGVKAPAAPDPV